ncbi:MAG: dihydropyrimidinase [Chloroflexi bacterium]|nr:dihydropyrimidinase [Chloroflexota bacterium]
MEKTTLITNGLVVTETGTYPLDLLVRGQRIVALGRELPRTGVDRVIDATGMFVLPGVVDPHVHIQLDTGIYRTDDDWEIGTRVAAFGGVTTVVDFATQFPGQDVREAVQNRHDEVDHKALVDYGLHVMLTDLPEEDDQLEAWMRDLVTLGTPAAKIYTTYRPNYYQDDAALMRVFRAAARTGVLVMVHAENDAIVTYHTQKLVREGKTSLTYHAQARPPLAEAEAVRRVLYLAHEAQCPVYIVHCSTDAAVEAIHKAKQEGQTAYAELCPQYLLLDDSAYEGPHPEWVIMQPPLRPAPIVQQQWKNLEMGKVDALGTDHCDYSIAQKTATGNFTNTPGGIPGLETALPLMATYAVLRGSMDWHELMRLMSTRPAQLFGLYPRKGTLLPGSDADIVLYDPRGTRRIHARDLHGVSGYTPYEGMEVDGRVYLTMVRGRVVVEDGELTGTPGWGVFVPGTAGAWPR